MTMTETSWGGGVSDGFADLMIATPLVLPDDVKRRIMPDPVVHKSTVEGLVVPWDRPTWVADDMPDGTRKSYREGFRRTAVDEQFFKSEGQMRAVAGRIMFRHMHSRTDGFGPLGIGRAFEVRDEGLWAEFHIVEKERSTLASLVEHGISGLSVEFLVRDGDKEPDADGVVWRTDVLLRGVALEWAGAYPEAQVLVMRAEASEEEQEQAALQQAERERQQAADAEAAAEAQAEKERAEQAAEAKRKQAEVDAWLVEQQAKQAELAARYK